ncbi:MAG: hypothetical protein WKG07_13590 [Hymenobacter sp.]
MPTPLPRRALKNMLAGTVALGAARALPAGAGRARTFKIRF